MDLQTLLPANMSPEQVGDMLRHLLTELEPPSVNQLSSVQIDQLQRNLPRLTSAQIDASPTYGTCPICFVAFDALLSEEETGLAMDTPALPIEELGVTRLQCGHTFCRRDISQWIREGRDSCPLCRQSLLEAPPTPLAEGPQELPQDSQRPLDDALWREFQQMRFSPLGGTVEASHQETSREDSEFQESQQRPPNDAVWRGYLQRILSLLDGNVEAAPDAASHEETSREQFDGMYQ